MENKYLILIVTTIIVAVAIVGTGCYFVLSNNNTNNTSNTTINARNNTHTITNNTSENNKQIQKSSSKNNSANNVKTNTKKSSSISSSDSVSDSKVHYSEFDVDGSKPGQYQGMESGRYYEVWDENGPIETGRIK